MKNMIKYCKVIILVSLMVLFLMGCYRLNQSAIVQLFV